MPKDAQPFTKTINKCQKMQINVYMQARLNAGIRSRGKASGMLPITERTLARIERGKRIPAPEEVMVMAAAYNQPSLLIQYCAETCAIGKWLETSPEKHELDKAITGMAKTMDDAAKYMDRLSEIAEDNRLSNDKLQDIEKIMYSCISAQRVIDTLKLRISKIINVSYMQGEKRNE